VNNFGRNLALWVIVALLLVALFNLFQPSSGTGRASQQVAYSDFLNEVTAGHVRDVTIQGRQLTGQLADGRSFQTYTPEDPTLVSKLTERGVRVVARPEESDINPLFQYLLYLGAMRIAPSRRMVVPLSIGFRTMASASCAYSAGSPSRDGNGTCWPSDSCAFSGRPANIGVLKRPGAMVITRMPSRARSRAMGNVMATMAPLDAE
jgi:hypothetical protein